MQDKAVKLVGQFSSMTNHHATPYFTKFRSSDLWHTSNWNC